MIISLLQDIANKFITRIEKFSKSKFWLAKSVIILTIITLFFSFPNYREAFSKNVKMEVHDSLTQTRVPTIMGMVAMQIKDPMMVVRGYNGAQPEKRQFRLTMPVIGHFLHLNVLGLIILQQLVGILFFGLLILLISNITGDRVIGILMTTGLAFTYLGKASFVDLWPWFDGVAYCLLAAAMYSRKPVLISLFILLAAFTDERALVASALVFFWWKLQNQKESKMSLSTIVMPDLQSFAVVIAWIVYFSIRIFLTKRYGFLTHSGYMTGAGAAFKITYKYFTFGVLSGIEWFWIYILAGIVLLLKQKNYMTTFLLISMLGVILLIAFDVFDVTKSTTYVFPAIFICLYLFIKNGETIKNLRYFAIIVMILCFLLPSFNISGPIKYMLKPVFFELPNR